MVATLAESGEEAIAHGFAGCARDDMRDAPHDAQLWLIEKTIVRMAEKYDDPSQIYLVDDHPAVKTADGFILGSSPFREIEPALDFTTAVTLVSSPEEIIARSLADTSRKRTSDPAVVRGQQNLYRTLSGTAARLAGHPHFELPVPNNQTRQYEVFIRELQIRVHQLAALNHTREDFDRLGLVLDAPDFVQAYQEAFSSGRIYDLFPEFRSFPDNVLGHKLGVVQVFQPIIDGDAGVFFKSLFEKDTDRENYSRNFARFAEMYHRLSPAHQRILRLALVTHDMGKFITKSPLHMISGERIVPFLAKAFGMSKRDEILWQAIEGYHGWYGDIAMGLSLPAGLLRVAERVEGHGVDPNLYLRMLSVVNLCDLASYKTGKILKNEYLVLFSDLADKDALEALQRDFYDFRLRVFSTAFTDYDKAVFDQARYDEMKRLIEALVPSDEVELFRDDWGNRFDKCYFPYEMWILSLKSRVKFMRILSLFYRGRKLDNYGLMCLTPQNCDEVYPRDLEGWLDKIPDNFSAEQFQDNLTENGVFGLPFYLLGDYVVLDTSFGNTPMSPWI